LVAKDRAWQVGTWRDVEVTRPKVVVGLQPSPMGGPPGVTTPMEVRIYVIETSALHLELKDAAPSNAPAFDVAIGGPVTFALEKDTVYVLDAKDTEHALHVTKKRTLAQAPR
jgi:hypothetical protein